MVLDRSEIKNIFDAEFGKRHWHGKNAREEIRRDHEAFWSAGEWNPANFIPPTRPSLKKSVNSSTCSTGPERRFTPACFQENCAAVR